jgi:hypothetical protein
LFERARPPYGLDPLIDGKAEWSFYGILVEVTTDPYELKGQLIFHLRRCGKDKISVSPSPVMLVLQDLLPSL